MACRDTPGSDPRMAAPDNGKSTTQRSASGSAPATASETVAQTDTSGGLTPTGSSGTRPGPGTARPGPGTGHGLSGHAGVYPGLAPPDDDQARLECRGAPEVPAPAVRARRRRSSMRCSSPARSRAMFARWRTTIAAAAPAVNASTGHEAPKRAAKAGSESAAASEATEA